MTFLDRFADGIISGDLPFSLIFLMLFGSIALLALLLVQAIRALRRPGLAGVLYAVQLILGFWAIIIGAYLPWTTPFFAAATIWITWKLRTEDPDYKWLPTLTGFVIVLACLANLSVF